LASFSLLVVVIFLTLAFEFSNGYPSGDATRRLRDALVFNRAVEAYLVQMHGVSWYRVWKRVAEAGPGAPNQLVIWETLMDGATLLLTGNCETVYGLCAIDLKRDYAVGWAHAMDTPYQWTKQVASHWGGTRNGTIVHWPKGIKGKGEVRAQFHHVIDVAPTILELAHLPQPTMVNGVLQRPIEGVSMAYSFNDAAAADRHETQYFEMFGNRGIYHKGWTAVTKHRTPWETGQVETIAFNDDVWELYDTSKDWSQARDLSKEQPEMLHKLQQLWLIEAVKYNVLPSRMTAAALPKAGKSRSS